MKFYCSICGVELVHTRKAGLTEEGRPTGQIFDLIEPHECEGYAVKEVEDGQPTILEILSKSKPLGAIEVVSDGRSPEGRYTEPGDRRAEKTEVSSIAPPGLLRAMRDLPPSEGEDDFG